MRKRLNLSLLFILDSVIIFMSIFIAYYLRFGRNLTYSFFEVFLYMAPFVIVGKITILYFFGFYKNIWIYAGIHELVNLFAALCISNGVVINVIYLGHLKVPRSIYVTTLFVELFLFGISRFSPKIFRRISINDFTIIFSKGKFRKVMVVGAGEAGSLLIQEYKSNLGLRIKPICLIDDDSGKQDMYINGVPVVGTRTDIAACAIEYSIDEIIIAIPSAKASDIRKLIEECRKTSCDLKILPGISELHEIKGDIGEILIRKIRNIDVNDLLGRDKIKLDETEVSSYINGKAVLITGAGGSIGSELSRQVAKYNPLKMILLDINENNLYSLEDELNYAHPDVDKLSLIASVQDKDRLDSIFREHQPQVVFHSAAHKHVPMMEYSPGEAIKNNVFGTLNIVKMSEKYGAEKFILISSDKAVNPTNVMGASKRICEMIVQAHNSVSRTEFVAVRFGNVLGSSGSVIPLFKKQIERGGPVTVTHPDIIRYFMTITEAVQLVLQSSAMARGGEIFVLDMGEPVKIDKLARDLIRLSGFEPDRDIEIKYTGLRPGEKLYEELLINEMNVDKTHKEKIFVEKPLKHDLNSLIDDIIELEHVVNGDIVQIKLALKKIVPTYIENND